MCKLQYEYLTIHHLPYHHALPVMSVSFRTSGVVHRQDDRGIDQWFYRSTKPVVLYGLYTVWFFKNEWVINHYQCFVYYCIDIIPMLLHWVHLLTWWQEGHGGYVTCYHDRCPCLIIYVALRMYFFIYSVSNKCASLLLINRDINKVI